MKRALTAIATGLLLAAAAQAQTQQPSTQPAHAPAARPLNLKLPPSDIPAPAGTAAKPASAPGVYYGDTSGRTDAGDRVAAAPPACDDATYNQPQVHGSVGMGVVSGSHMGTGTWNSGAVSVTQNLGDCEHHTGSVGISIGVDHFDGGGFRGRRF